jgi:uncharacterized protein (DUF58 family)
MLGALLLLQAAAQAPDIELNIRARARSVEIQQKGEAKLEVRAEPDGVTQVQAQVRPANKGASKLDNVEINVHAEASVGQPAQIRAEAETGAPR